MKLVDKTRKVDGKHPEVFITWGDHEQTCKQCRHVDLGKSATFVRACAMGSALLTEELRKRAAIPARQKARDVEEWAKKTGNFAEFDRGKPDHVRRITRYVGEGNGSQDTEAGT